MRVCAELASDCAGIESDEDEGAVAAYRAEFEESINKAKDDLIVFDACKAKHARQVHALHTASHVRSPTRPARVQVSDKTTIVGICRKDEPPTGNLLDKTTWPTLESLREAGLGSLFDDFKNDHPDFDVDTSKWGFKPWVCLHGTGCSRLSCERGPNA